MEENKNKNAREEMLQSSDTRSILIARLIIASILFAVSLIVKMPDFVSMLLLIVAAVAAGYDIVLSAMSFIEAGDFLSTPMTVFFVAFVSFFIGFGIEGAALTILYQIGMLLIDYAEDRIKRNALDMLKYENDDVKTAMESTLEDENSTCTGIEQSMGYNSGIILKIAMLFAIVYAVVMPLLSNMTYAVSIHRALMILLVSTPMSVVVSIPSAAIIGLCRSAQLGLTYKTASDMEKAGSVNIAVFDKDGVVDGGEPKLAGMKTTIIDESTFLDFAAHAVYYSEQPFANAVSSIYKKEYMLDYISDFNDIPGCGVELKIKGLEVVLGTRELFAKRGEHLPRINDNGNILYYMTVSGRQAGWLAVSNDINSDIVNIVESMKDAGFNSCILITEDGKDETLKLADEMGFDDAYDGFDTEKKLAFIDYLKSKGGNIVFIYSTGIEGHSKADIDIRVGNKTKFANALLREDYISNLPAAMNVSGRVKEIATENSIFAFIVKMIIIFLSITGFCNIWFAVFIDLAAALATMLNASRVTSDSLIGTFLYKIGR